MFGKKLTLILWLVDCRMVQVGVQQENKMVMMACCLLEHTDYCFVECKMVGLDYWWEMNMLVELGC